MSRLRRVTRLCSSMLSVNCEQVAKNTVEKILCRTQFRSGHMSVICARLGSKGKVGVQRGRKTAGCPSFLPPRRAPRRSRRPQTANPPAEVQRKTLRPPGANPPAAVRVPRSADAEKELPVRGEPACGSSCAPVSRCSKRSRPSGAEPACGSSRAPLSRCRKGAARTGRTRLRQFEHPAHLVPRKEKHRRIASTVLKVCTFTQIAAAYRHPYAPEPAGPVPDDRVR